jgi:hypothetical protein
MRQRPARGSRGGRAQLCQLGSFTQTTNSLRGGFGIVILAGREKFIVRFSKKMEIVVKKTTIKSDKYD